MKNLDIKTFKKKFKFICKKCGKFLDSTRGYCRRCGAHAPRKALDDDYTNYKKFDKIKKQINSDLVGKEQITRVKMSYEGQLRTLRDVQKTHEEMRYMFKKRNPLYIKATSMLDKKKKVLLNLLKKDEDFRELVVQKEKGESVERLIEKNRTQKKNFRRRK